jgi:hypothetical protein
VREGGREGGRGPVYIYIYIYICVCVCVCVLYAGHHKIWSDRRKWIDRTY